MKITNLTITLFAREDKSKFQYGPNNQRTGRTVLGLVTVSTDEGVNGYSFLGSPTKSAELDAFSLVQMLRPMIVGQDPLNREHLYKELCRRVRQTSWRCIGAVDVALWDIAGKVAGLPIYKLIGAYRDKAPAYASSPGFTTPEQYADHVREVKEKGYNGYKIHPPRAGWRGDAAVCRAVRKAIGDDFPLMLDGSWQYSYGEALEVGFCIGDLGYRWYEDPLSEDDIYNYAKLREKVRVPLMATEFSSGAFHTYAPWITERATDYLRGDVAVKGGITACLKTAHLAEAFKMNYEMHHGGNSINNIANLHVMCAVPNSEFFEVITPPDAQKFGLVKDLDVDSQGMISVPQGPGLGVEIDFDLIEKVKIGFIGQ